MGIVYEGRDPNLDRRVAIKTVKVENMSEEAAAEYEARFRIEARSAARLQHPNIVSVYDSDRDGDIAFLVMEFIQGDDLKHHIDNGARYSLDQSLKMVRDLLAALDYAHKQGIVHRDIKPANLLIEPGGRIKLTDFGVARIQDSGEATRTQGAMVGTLKYMSPEQVQGQPVDSRADLFSVGIVLYQLLTDRRPFDGENDFSIIHQIIGHSPAAPSTINLQLPSAIDTVVARALAKKRDDRYATARDFAVALQDALRSATDQTVVPPINPGRRTGAAHNQEAGSNVGTNTNSNTNTNSYTSTSTNTSTVTQELELVYWKDIKDSTDPEEIEGFLGRFPTGIYADLARRRLKKLANGPGSDGTNIGFGSPVASSAQDTDATRMRSDVSRPAVPTGPATAAAKDASEDDATRTLVVSRGQLPETVTAPVASPVASPVPRPEVAPVQTEPVQAAVDPREATTIPPIPGAVAAPDAPASSSAAARTPPVSPAPAPNAAASPAQAKPKTALYAVAGIAAVAVIGLVLKLSMGGGGAASTAAASASAPAPASTAAPVPVPAAISVPAPAAVTTASAVAVDTAAAPAAAPVAPASASATLAAASRAASAPRPGASQLAARAKAKASSSNAAVLSNATPTPAAPPAPARVESAPSRPAPAVAASPTNPRDACEGRILIGFQICLTEQCTRPSFQNHPVCVERREMENRRREAQQRN
ncbi:MAG: serine/threonine protein kinase [Bdellovibrionales bacterium]|nr:serine/threonine protein kinase [Ramlibacter sp.]